MAETVFSNNMWGRKSWYGWWDMGPTQIPVLPQYMILTDRTTGLLWQVTWNAGPPMRVSIINPPPNLNSTTKYVFAAGEEPFFDMGIPGTPEARLIVDTVNGVTRLGVEVLTLRPQESVAHGSTGLWARQGLNPTVLKIIFSSTLPNEYAWQVFTA